MTQEAITAQIRTDSILRNLSAIRRRIGSQRSIIVAIKANAYGHGVENVLPALEQGRIDGVAVANLTEALRIRSLGWTGTILCFGAPLATGNAQSDAEAAMEAAAADITCTVSSTPEVRTLSVAASSLQKPARIQVKIDTGMGRMGLPAEEALPFVAAAARLSAVQIEGVYTHFATADEADLSFARAQLDRFLDLRASFIDAGLPIAAYHAANSAATFRLPDSHLNLVRPGLAVYGCWDGPAEERPEDLHPAMRVVGRLVAIRSLPAGHAIGYGRTFKTQRESLIGVVPVGYEDGYLRQLSGKAVMTLNPARDRSAATVPVVGRISMDLTTIDLTGLDDVRVGDPVTIISDDPAAPNSVEAIARQIGTIPYEITCLLGQRVKRQVITGENAQPTTFSIEETVPLHYIPGQVPGLSGPANADREPGPTHPSRRLS